MSMQHGVLIHRQILYEKMIVLIVIMFKAGTAIVYFLY